jgi:hypothetical protein
VVNPPVSIQTSSLPGGWVTRSVSGSITTSGGTSPVTFQVVGGAMPSGVSLGWVDPLAAHFHRRVLLQ